MTKTRINLEDKVAVVTGATGILGRRFCHGLAEAGASVIVSDLDEQQCSELAAELGARYAGTSSPCVCDVTDRASLEALRDHVLDQYGRVDVLHNNAASKGQDLGEFFRSFEDYRLETWREIMAVNCDGMFLTAQVIGSEMARQRSGGSIIQTASIYGCYAPDMRIYEGSEYLGMSINTPAAYAVSKAAVVGLTRYLAAYWGDKNVRVNTLTPGGVESGQNDLFKTRYAARVPMGRMAQADEMVGALVYLASDASSYVTGQNLIVDGGLSVW